MTTMTSLLVQPSRHPRGTVAKLSRDRQRVLFRRLTMLQDRVARRLQGRLEAYFRQLGQRAARRYRQQVEASAPYEVKQVPPPLIYRVEDEALLERLLVAFETELAMMVAEAVEPLLSTQPPAREIVQQVARQNAARRVTNISDTIRQRIASTIERGLRDGLSDREVARNLARVVGSEGRAATIARTEMALAAQEAAHDRYARAGVEFVDISDGPGCGWTSHDDPDLADGSRRTIQEANEYPIAHPRCVRASFPVV